MTVLVLGSLNDDLVLRTPRLPLAGETIRATDAQHYPGGKGANQAVAAARMGARVDIVGRVGDDAAGAWLIEALQGAGVRTAAVTKDPREPTGTALITVAADGSNTIVTAGGANHRIGDAEIASFRERIGGAKVVLVQLEVPMEVVEAAVAIAAAAGVPVILDPAPFRELPDALCGRLTWITPNEHEAGALTGHDDAAAAGRELRARGVGNVVVTLGAGGALYVADGVEVTTPSPAVEAVDTVACGDAFNGCLGAALAGGIGPAAALRRACAAGAAASTVRGAYPSLPTARAVEALLDPQDL